MEEVVKLIEKCDNKLSKYIVENPKILYSSISGQSIYTLSAIKSLDCLKMVHNTYLYTLINGKRNGIEYSSHPYNLTDNLGRAPIHIMIMMKLKPQIDYLINTVGVDINIKDKENSTTLHYACKTEKIDTVKLLLNSGIKDINAVNDKIETPLLIAVLLKNYEIIKLLLYSGSSIYIKKGRFILNIMDFVNNNYPDNIKNLFTKYKTLSRKKQKQIMQKQKRKEQIIQYNIEYVDLCNNMDNYDLDAVKNLASAIKLIYPDDITKAQLCSKIAERLRILYSNPMIDLDTN
jgi:ankyrin repeat protein